MWKNIKNLNTKLNKNSEIFMLIALYFISILIILISTKIALNVNFFSIGILNNLFGLIIFFLAFIFTLNMLIKTILWINLNPKITIKERNKLKKSKESIKIKEHEISFKYWYEFFIFSLTVMATEYTPFFWTIKTAIMAHPLKLKKIIKGKKITSFTWGKYLDKKETICQAAFYYN